MGPVLVPVSADAFVAVDCWRPRPPPGSRVAAFFLTHAHADHMAGLHDGWSPETAVGGGSKSNGGSGSESAGGNGAPARPPPPAPRALLSLIKGPPPDSPREVIVENSVRVSRIIGSPGYPKTDEQLRADAIENYERCFYPQGIGRHFSAILGSGSLGRYDRQITAPTVVIHGRADVLMRPSGGRAIARAVSGARLVLFDGMAHDIPEPLFDDMVAELTKTFAEAQ